MIDLKYSLVIEATKDPHFFSYYSPDLEGFTGSCQSIEECIKKANIEMIEHVRLLEEKGLPVPDETSNPTITIRNAELLRRAV